MLLRLYYVYSKSPKKCRELTDIEKILGKCMNFQRVEISLWELKEVIG